MSDRDGDGVADARDNCAEAANADQRDRDGDGLGDACDGEPDRPALARQAGGYAMASVRGGDGGVVRSIGGAAWTVTRATVSVTVTPSLNRFAKP